MFTLAAFDYQYVTGTALEAADALIRLYDLHATPQEAVNVSPLLDKFDLRFMDLPPTTWGFALDEGGKIVIAVNDQLSTEQTRYVALHEVGHIACWHPDHLHNCLEGQPRYDKVETEAVTVAALVLIPRCAVAALTPRRIPQVARHYSVPPELLLIRRGLYLHSGV